MDGLNEGTLVGAETATETGNVSTDNGIQAEIDKGNVRPDFLNTINEFRKEAGLDPKVAPETAPTEQKTEEKLDQPKEEKVVEEAAEKPADKKEGEQEDSEELKTPEGESVKATRIAEVKEWGKGWQTTASEYKPAHDFVTERFQGNMEEADTAANLFEAVLGTELDKFDPNSIFEQLSELSKPRAEKLIQFFATNESVQKMAERGVIEKVFGKDLSAEELQEDLEGYKLFKQAGGLSALLGEDGELPAQLRYDAEGNPRSEEEVDMLKTFLNEVKGIKTDRQKEAEQRLQAERQQQEQRLHQTIESYTEERFDGVKAAIKNVGLEIEATDSDEVKAAKTRDSKMINFYVAGMASEDPAFRKTYTEAVDAIKAGDNFTANRRKIELNRMVAQYTSDIIDDYITKNNIKIDKTNLQIDKAKDTKKEIALGGGGEGTAVSTRPANESVEAAVDRLVKEGKIRKG